MRKHARSKCVINRAHFRPYSVRASARCGNTHEVSVRYIEHIFTLTPCELLQDAEITHEVSVPSIEHIFALTPCGLLQDAETRTHVSVSMNRGPFRPNSMRASARCGNTHEVSVRYIEHIFALTPCGLLQMRKHARSKCVINRAHFCPYSVRASTHRCIPIRTGKIQVQERQAWQE